MNLSAEDQAIVKEAERALELAAKAPAKINDVAEKRRAADAIRWAAIRYALALNTADSNTRNAALAKNTTELFARLERISA